MPGQGDSDDPEHPYDADSLAAIVSDGVTRVTHAAEPLRFVCFSFGSIIGGLVAAGLGERVVSYTGVGAAGLGARSPITQQMRRIAAGIGPVFFGKKPPVIADVDNAVLGIDDVLNDLVSF